MSFRVFDYRCNDCNHLELDRFVRASESDDQHCELCGGTMKKLLAAPKLDIGAMAKAGCPGAYETVGNRLERQHRAVDQYHRSGDKRRGR